MLFVEAKWFYNHILSQKNVFDVDYKKVDITVLNKRTGEKTERTIEHLGSSLRVSLAQQIQYQIIALSKAKKKGIKVGRLKFKRDFRTIELKNDAYRIISKNRIRIQTIKKPFIVRGLKQIPEDVEFANAKLMKKPSGYYIRVTTYATPTQVENKERKDVGLDFGIRDHVTTSEGEKFNWSIEETERLKRLQRRFFKAKKGSNNRRKIIKFLDVEYEKVSNRKNDAANKFVNYLLSTYHTIYIQDDDFSKWKKEKKRGYGRVIQHSILGRIKRKLIESKKHKRVVVIERFAPSTKQCHVCGTLNVIEQSAKIFKCSKCRHREDRDIKAAKTIMLFGKIDSLDLIPVIPVDRRDSKLVENCTSSHAGAASTLR